MSIWLAYCRKSRISIRDWRAVESTDRPRDRIASWAEARGEAVEFYVEPEGHRSAGSTKAWPQYACMMQRIRAAWPRTIAGVVVTKIDRTSRSPSDFFQFLDELKARGLEYVALDQSFDTSTPHGRAMLGMMIENTADRQDASYYVGPDMATTGGAWTRSTARRRRSCRTGASRSSSR